MSDIINKWSVLQKLTETFLLTINLVYIFGANGKQAIIITNDDNVYAFGDNDSNGCLGLGHTNAVQQPTKIEELCGKQVIQIELSVQYNYVIARTLCGHIYSWGHNYNGELGIGNYRSQLKPKMISILSDKNVTDIKSCTRHSLALTECGDVYVWGRPRGNTPIKLKIESQNRKIIAISSGSHYALALTNTGNVYYWGNNRYGQCGNCSNNNKYSTNWCELQNIAELNATKIACGPNHSMILSTKGIVYCFGDNQSGQCGDGTNVNKIIPTKVNIMKKFIDISATKHYNMSVALSDNGYCYMWGECGQNPIINNPIEIPCNNISEVVQHYSINKVTIMPLVLNDKDCKHSSIMDIIRNMFNKREYSDIAFKVEDKYIYARKSYLNIVSKHFQTMFSGNNLTESNLPEIEINDYSHSVYYAFIKYLYTDCVDVNPDEDAFKLIALAELYADVTLKQRCVEIIKNSITKDNVLEIYSTARTCKSIEMMEYCKEYLTK